MEPPKNVQSPQAGHPSTDVRDEISRRSLLVALGVGAALVMTPVSFATASTGSSVTRKLTGRLEPGAADFVYIPIDIPSGVSKIRVSYTYSKPEVPQGTGGNACDIGIFDAKWRGAGDGFRGWSGGSRTEFFVGAAEATPGYLPGKVDAGRWYVVLSPYYVCPQGMDWEVTVTLESGQIGRSWKPQFPSDRARGRGKDWYRGDCHLHTVHSDGRYLPEEMVDGARAAGLDFFVSTEHNTSSAHGVWGPLASDDLLIITGEEVTTRNGHWLALGIRPGRVIDWRYRSRDRAIGQHIDRVHRDGGLAVSAHLFCPWVGAEWKFGFEGLDATEVWTGPWGWDDEAAVSAWANMLAESSMNKRGTWIPAMGNSDAHRPGDKIGEPHNVVLAEDLTRKAILTGLRKGRSWIAESSSVQVSLSASCRGSSAVGIGERLRVPRRQPISVQLTAEGVPGGTLRLLTDQGQMIQAPLSTAGSGTLTWTTRAEIAAFVRAEVRHPKADGNAGAPTMDPTAGFGPMAALTNPIWFDIGK